MVWYDEFDCMILYAIVWDSNAMLSCRFQCYVLRFQCYAMVYVLKDMLEPTVQNDDLN